MVFAWIVSIRLLLKKKLGAQTDKQGRNKRRIAIYKQKNITRWNIYI